MLLHGGPSAYGGLIGSAGGRLEERPKEEEKEEAFTTKGTKSTKGKKEEDRSAAEAQRTQR